MTVGKLKKILGRIKNDRMVVSVDVTTLPGTNGVFQVCGVDGAKERWVTRVDDDGFTEWRKDGSERGSVQLVLTGKYG